MDKRPPATLPDPALSLAVTVMPSCGQPSPYDAAALRAAVARLRRDLGDQLMSLSGGAGFPTLHS